MAEDIPTDHEWFAVRCIFHDRARDAYEERITLWKASSFDQAISLAEDDARAYAGVFEATDYVGLAQAYSLSEVPSHGAEIFSLIRDSTLAPAEYLTTYFDSGTERQQHHSG